jgi:hypothetical protein
MMEDGDDGGERARARAQDDGGERGVEDTGHRYTGRKAFYLRRWSCAGTQRNNQEHEHGVINSCARLTHNLQNA